MNNLPASQLIKNQKKVLHFSNITTEEYGVVDIKVTLRHDDCCQNGHNSFAMTGDIYKAGKPHIECYMITCGAIYDTIAKYIPELAHLAKWHLCSTDSPMHYVANTMYHARIKTHDDVEIGDAVAWDTRLKFENIPFTFKEHGKGFWDYLNYVGDFNNIEVESVKYDGKDTYDFKDKYSLTGYIKSNEVKKWYKAPFNSLIGANEFLTALQNFEYEFVKIPTKFCEAVEPDLEAARRCAIWETATLEQLQNEALLVGRLPKLMEDFKNDIERLGFIY